MRLFGNIDVKLDAKGRVFIPVLFRRVLQSASSSGLVLKRDVYKNALVLYPESIWNDHVDRLRSALNPWSEQQQQLYRQYLIDVEYLEMDASGRILIPKRYIQAIGLGAEARFLGLGDTIEIWSRKSLESSMISADEYAHQINSLLGEGSAIQKLL